MALRAVQVQELDGDRLSLQTGPELVVDEAFMDRPEPAFAEEVAGREALRDDLKLGEKEDVEVGAGEGYGQVLRERCRARVAQIRKRYPLEGSLLRHNLLRLIRLREIGLVTARHN